MAYTIKEIMLATCGTDTYPRRWETFFDEVMASYEKNGCPLLDPAYYTAIEEEYGIIGEDLPVYQQAAREIAADEMLSRYMALLCHALTERDTIKADLAEISFPPGVLVTMIRRDGKFTPAHGNSKIAAGDGLLIMAETQLLTAVEKRFFNF